MTSIKRNGPESGATKRLREEYEELGVIAETYWESMVSIARYTRRLEREVEPATIEGIREEARLDDPTPEEAA